MHHIFTELRELLHEGPSQASWEKLCTLVERPQCPSTAIDYAQHHLVQWDNKETDEPWGNMPSHWLTDLPLKAKPLALVRTIHLSMDDFRLDAQHMLVPPLHRLAHLDLPYIHTLTLDTMFLSDPSWRALSRAPWLSNLAEVGLNCSYITDHSDAPLSLPVSFRGHVPWGELLSNVTSPTRLNFERCLGLSELETLMEQVSLERLEHLEIRSSSLGDHGLEVLLQAELPSLRVLKLQNVELTPYAARLLAHASHLNNLDTLVLSQNGLADEGLQVLSQAQHLSSLRFLCMCHNGITPQGLEKLIHSPVMCALQGLDLSWNTLGDAGALLLSQAPYLDDLDALYMFSNNVQSGGYDALKQRWPHLKDDLERQVERDASPWPWGHPQTNVTYDSEGNPIYRRC